MVEANLSLFTIHFSLFMSPYNQGNFFLTRKYIPSCAHVFLVLMYLVDKESPVCGIDARFLTNFVHGLKELKGGI